MRKRSILLLIAVLSFGAGLVASMFIARLNTPTPDISPKYRCPTVAELVATQKEQIVISVASESEYFMGRERIYLPEIAERIAGRVGSQATEERIVFLRAAPTVSYSVVSAIVEKLKEAKVNRIELLPNKKKDSAQ